MSGARSVAPPPAPTVLRMVLGNRLAALRQAAGASYEQAAAEIGASALTVRRLENGDVGLKPAYVKLLLAAYGVPPDETAEFLHLVTEARKPGWWHRYRDALPSWFSAFVSLENSAEEIRIYEPQFVSGLLQVDAYARAVLNVSVPPASPDEVERRLALRMARQELLHRPSAPTVRTIMDEAVFRRPAAGPEIMLAQIDHLLEVATSDRIALQYLPFAAGPHAAPGPIHFFRFAQPELPDIAYAESLTSAVYLDEDEDVVAHLQVLDRLSEMAESEAQTRVFLEAIRKEYR
ncbi:helix-turn-helix domain-containing protein [Streptomyces sp. IBSBF 2435]|uniref:helix-turn-helix domain-containing protein n=1 Tax=Streptomyces sp. IBSBF 2435 TaxID=2903531 RepID=UPI002FDBF981